MARPTFLDMPDSEMALEDDGTWTQAALEKLDMIDRLPHPKPRFPAYGGLGEFNFTPCAHLVGRACEPEKREDLKIGNEYVFTTTRRKSRHSWQSKMHKIEDQDQEKEDVFVMHVGIFTRVMTWERKHDHSIPLGEHIRLYLSRHQEVDDAEASGVQERITAAKEALQEMQEEVVTLKMTGVLRQRHKEHCGPYNRGHYYECDDIPMDDVVGVWRVNMEKMPPQICLPHVSGYLVDKSKPASDWVRIPITGCTCRPTIKEDGRLNLEPIIEMDRLMRA